MAKNNTARVLEEVVEAPVAEVVAVQVDDKGLKSTVDLSMEQVAGYGWKNTSQTIRGLSGLGYSRSAIAKFTGKRYQHVRNVLITPLKKS